MSQSGPPPKAPATGGHLTAATAAGAAVLSLIRAARSFTLYDPANKVVRQLIGDYKEKVRAALDAHGPMRLLVHPFELMLGAEQVYLEKDRERSLAFRLFRDGVREITLLPTVTWEEQLRLLEVLSVGFTGVRQQEDDLVTLLRKAEFKGITIAAIEGYAPEEEQAEPQTEGDGAWADAGFEAPAQWDRPLPQFSEAVALHHRALAPETLARLGAEETADRLPEQGMRAALALMEAASEPGDKAAAESFAREVKEFLLVEGRADLVAQLSGRMAASGVVVDTPDLRALLLAQPTGAQELSPDLARMLDAAGDGALGEILDLIASEGSGAHMPVLLQAARHVGGDSAEALQARLRDAPEEQRGAILQVLAEVDPQSALAGFLDAVGSGGTSLHLQALALAERLRPGPAHLRLLRRLLTAGTGEVRLRAIHLLPKVGGPRAFPVLESFSQEHAAKAAPDEIEALGEALAQSDPRAALELFKNWIHPAGGLLGRLTGGSASAALQRMALAGMGRMGGEAVSLLQQVAAKGDPALRAQAAAILAGGRPAAPPEGTRHG